MIWKPFLPSVIISQANLRAEPPSNRLLIVFVQTMIIKLMQDLAIKDGSQATYQWQIAVDSYTPLATQQEIFQDLRKYCSRDTWVMVEIYRHLKKILNEG